MSQPKESGTQAPDHFMNGDGADDPNVLDNQVAPQDYGNAPEAPPSASSLQKQAEVSRTLSAQANAASANMNMYLRGPNGEPPKILSEEEEIRAQQEMRGLNDE